MRIKADPPISFISYTFIDPFFELEIMNLAEKYQGKCIEKKSFDTNRHLFFSFSNISLTNKFDNECRKMIKDKNY